MIDILQQYSALKKLEHSFKSTLWGSDAVSCADPYFYQQRFLRKIAPHLMGDDPTASKAAVKDEEGEDVELERIETEAERKELQSKREGLMTHPHPAHHGEHVEEKQSGAHNAASTLAIAQPAHSWPAVPEALTPLPEGSDERASASPSPIIAATQPPPATAAADVPAASNPASVVPMELTPLTPVPRDRTLSSEPGFISVDVVRVA